MSFYQPGDVVYARLPYEENSSRLKPRPVLIVSIESDTLYKVLKITKQDKSRFPECYFISKTSYTGKSMGLKIDSYLDKRRIIPLPASLIIQRESPWGEYPEIDDLLEELGL